MYFSNLALAGPIILLSGPDIFAKLGDPGTLLTAPKSYVVKTSERKREEELSLWSQRIGYYH